MPRVRVYEGNRNLVYSMEIEASDTRDSEDASD